MDELSDNPLRTARERRNVSLSAIAAAAGVSERMLHLIDEGRFDELPRGLYARAYVRGYARAVGVNPDDALRVIGARLPTADDSFAAIVDTRRAARRASPSAQRGLPEVFSRAALVPIIDGVILATIAALSVLATAAVCQVAPALLLDLAAPAVGLLCGVIACCYFGLLAGVTGRTPGGWIAGLPEAADLPRRTDLAGALRRAWRCALMEASLLLELAMGGFPQRSP